MSSFRPLNVEPDDDSAQELGDTREVHLEYAFKLYHNALRLHSLGPEFQGQAEKAYEELFGSEIFSYPDAVSEYHRNESDNHAETTPIVEESAPKLDVLPSLKTEASSSSLPQILYLSFKNYGQFLLELYAYRYLVSRDRSVLTATVPLTREWKNVCVQALKKFAEALESDDTDLELWRKAARISQLSASHRIFRFCLESVLTGDDEEAIGATDIVGLDEAIAVGQLKEFISLVRDDLSIAQDLVELRPDLLESLNWKSRPCSVLPASIDSEICQMIQHEGKTPPPPARYTISDFSHSWLGLGQALLQMLNNLQELTRWYRPGAAVYLDIPMEGTRSTVERPLRPFISPRQSPRPEESNPKHKIAEDIETNKCTVAGSFAKENLHSVAQELEETKGDVPPISTSNVATSSSWPETPVAMDHGLCNVEKPDFENGDVMVSTRKRSAAMAGHEDPPDGGRSKSKRLRNRESNIDAVSQEEENAISLARRYDDQIAILTDADDSLFCAESHLLARLSIDGLESVEDLRQNVLVSQEECAQQQTLGSTALSMNDLRSVLMYWSEEKAHSTAHGMGTKFSGGGKAGLAVFLEHSRSMMPKSAKSFPHTSQDGLAQFANRCNQSGKTAFQLVLEWLETLVRPIVTPSTLNVSNTGNASSYMDTLWPECLKQTVAEIIVILDEYIYQVMHQRLADMTERLFSPEDGTWRQCTAQDIAFAHMTQTLYELHLDVYCTTPNPDNEVTSGICAVQRDRLNRWSDMAASWVNICSDSAFDHASRKWSIIRFIWTATTHAKLADDASQGHVMLCLKDLQQLLEAANNPTIILPNNATMPEISATVLDREISRISTLNFFIQIFDDDSDDPISVVESLEPILEPYGQSRSTSLGDDHQVIESPSPSTQTGQLVEFLESGDASLKLFLWRRLRDAYIAIDYGPKVVSCFLRSFEVIISELFSERHRRLSSSARQIVMLKWIKELDSITTELIQIVSSEKKPFEVVDSHHLEAGIGAVARLCRLFHGMVLIEDAFRVGRLPEPKAKIASGGTKSLDRFREKLKDMYLRTRMFQYILFKEGMSQHPDQFDAPLSSRAEYLQSLHKVLGLRGYCKYSDKMLLRFLKTELMAMGSKDNHITEIAQVLFDLYQLKVAPGSGDWDHNCPPEPLDRKSAFQVLELVMMQAGSMNMKDLLKSELKVTVEKLQQTLGTPKVVPVLSYNRRAINAYLKSPVNHLQLCRASRGQGDLPIRVAKTESVKLAELGWYFLLGNLALARFKSTKRTSAGPTDDLDYALTVLKYDLEHGIEKWETWFRLGQVYDAKIDEDLLWNAEKVNSHRRELANLQRNAIHCYEMAMACSIRHASDTVDTVNKISEMYACFSIRLYASSREPLSMDAFDNNNHKRPYSSSNDQSVLFQGPSTPSMSLSSVWRFSTYLLRRALVRNPQNWHLHYLLGKCLWKLLTTPGDSRRRINPQEVLDEFTEAIECLPEKKDTRADRILEPHFKLVSVVHKLVSRKVMTPAQGSRALQATPWARHVHLADEDDSWEPYVLGILKKIGHADKSNWHHRIVARAAHVNYDDQQNIAGALGAKHEFTQQIFTKTMNLQIWKPEFERAGRHFVYTSRYVLFFVGILSHLSDRSNLDLLVRRIRRKPGDYLNHQQVWEHVVTSYLGLLRQLAKVPIGYEEAIFRPMDHDDFFVNSEKLEIYAHNVKTSDPALDVLRDVIEVKKLNNSLMKGALIDDLIVDCYAALFQNFVKALQPYHSAENPKDTRTRNDRIESTPDGGNPLHITLDSILTARGDGAVEPPNSSVMSAGVTPALAQKATRPKAVTRREVQRKAEALTLRSPPTKTPVIAKNSGHHASPDTMAEVSTKTTDRQAALETNFDKTTPPIEQQSGSMVDSRVGSPVPEEAGCGTMRSASSSRAGSIHDSADDESELSELEDPGQGLEDLSHEGSSEEQDNSKRTAAKPFVMFPQLVSVVKIDDDGEGSSAVFSANGSGTGDPAEKMEVK